MAVLRKERWELYDLKTDRVELRDLAAERSDPAGRLADQWNAWAEKNYMSPLPMDYRVGYLIPGR